MSTEIPPPMSGGAPQLLIALTEAARRLSVHRRTLEREICRMRFPRPLKAGRKTLVRVSDVDEYIRRLEAERDEKWQRDSEGQHHVKHEQTAHSLQESVNQ